MKIGTILNCVRKKNVYWILKKKIGLQQTVGPVTGFLKGFLPCQERVMSSTRGIVFNIPILTGCG